MGVGAGSLFGGSGDALVVGSADPVMELSEGAGVGPAVQDVRVAVSAKQKTETIMVADNIPFRRTVTAPLP